MPSLTSADQEQLRELSQRHGLSLDAVMTLLQALVQGNSTYAQFNHPELGGLGQWMSGGMIMIGDMFNQALKTKVNNLCMELSQLLQSKDIQLFETAGSSGGASREWWPPELGNPTASGAQNNLRYAYFAKPRRLVIDLNGQVSIYDTLDHQIGGVSQQQGATPTLCFSSQYGTINLSQLPVVTDNTSTAAPVSGEIKPESVANVQYVNKEDILTTIEKLAKLRERGVLSKKEFTEKKAELLSRL